MEIVVKEAELNDALEISNIAMETFGIACPKEADVYELKTYIESKKFLY